MRNNHRIGMGLAAFGLVALLGGTIQARSEDVRKVTIQIAPAMLLLGATQSGSVTIHTDIPYTIVDGSTVQLSGIPASATFSDDCGNLVGKFPEAKVKAIVGPPEAILTLTGSTKDGLPFAGSGVVSVRTRSK